MATQPELAAARSRLRRLREIEAALREVGVPPHPAIDLEIASLDVTENAEGAGPVLQGGVSPS